MIGKEYKIGSVFRNYREAHGIFYEEVYYPTSVDDSRYNRWSNNWLSLLEIRGL